MKQYIKMKNLKKVFLCALALVFTTQISFAQDPSVAKSEMKKLSKWVGEWQGEGWQTDQSGQRNTFKVSELVISKLNGLALNVEGKGTGSDGYVGHNAIGMIYYDINKRTFQFNSVTQEGTSAFTELTINADGAFIWGFDVPGGKVEFTISIDDENWIEKGAYSDGSNWYPFLEMKLKKVK